MIPTMILFGVVFGRWWKSALVVAAIGWPVLLFTTRIFQDSSSPLIGSVLAAAFLALANAAVGVGIHQLALYVLRHVCETQPGRDRKIT